jgi:hypothetical protein
MLLRPMPTTPPLLLLLIGKSASLEHYLYISEQGLPGDEFLWRSHSLRASIKRGDAPRSRATPDYRRRCR